jgi:hypothetical protein
MNDTITISNSACKCCVLCYIAFAFLCMERSVQGTVIQLMTDGVS